MAKKKRRPAADAERQPAVPEKDIQHPVPDEPDEPADAPADLIPDEPELTPAAEEPETDTAAETADGIHHQSPLRMRIPLTAQIHPQRSSIRSKL